MAETGYVNFTQIVYANAQSYERLRISRTPDILNDWTNCECPYRTVQFHLQYFHGTTKSL